MLALGTGKVKGMDGQNIQKIALQELVNMIDEKRLRCWFMSVFHNNTLVCGKCGKPLSKRAANAFLEYRWIRCFHCGKKIHFFQNTLLSSTKISPKVFYLLAVYLYLGVPVTTISQSLGISKTAVRMWNKKLIEDAADAS